MICPKCGNETEAGKKFCSRCGAPITGAPASGGQPPVRPAVPGAQPPVRPVVPGAQPPIRPVSGAQPPAPAPKKKGSAGKIIAIVLIVAAVVLIAAAAAFVFLSSKGGNQKNSVEEQLALGEKYLSEEDYERAVVAFRDAIKLDPKRADAYIGLADAYLADGNAEKAMEALDDAPRDVDDPDAIGEKTEEVTGILTDEKLALGESCLSESDYDGAIDAFESVIRLDSRRADAYIGLADAYLADGDADKAMEALDDAPRDVDDPDAIEDKIDEISSGESQETDDAGGTEADSGNGTETQPSVPGGSGAVLSSSEYHEICETLRAASPVSVSGQDELERMLKPLTDSDTLHAPGSLRMADLPHNAPNDFDWNIVDYYNGSNFSTYGVRADYDNNGYLNINKADFDGFLQDYYGGQAMNWDLTGANGWKSVNDDTLGWSGADGDPWVFGENPSFRENDGYILLSMPCYYGENASSEEPYEYSLDALFQKNSFSRFGVTLRYVETTIDAALQGTQSPSASVPIGPTGGNIRYVVDCDEWISLRSAASTQASTIIRIPLYSQVSYLSSAGNGFCQISYNGFVGYAMESYLAASRPALSSAAYRVVNARESITLRTEPSTSGAEILQIPLGAYVSVYRYTTADFYLVEYNGMFGYAMASYLSRQ